MLSIFSDINCRNSMFALLVGVLPLAAGSVSTALFFAGAAVLLVETGPVASMRMGRQALRVQPALWLVLAFFVYVSAVSLTGEDALRGLEFISSYLHFPFAILFVGWLAILSPKVDYIGLFVWGCRIGVLIAFAIGIWQLLNSVERVQGVSVNALLYATLCLVAGSVSVLKLPSDGKRERIFAWFAFFMGTAAVLMSFSRGIWLVLPVMFALVIAYLVGLRALKVRQVTFAVLVLVGEVAILQLAPSGSRELEQRIVNPLQNLRTGEIADMSVNHRLDLLRTSWHAFLESPVVGYGMQNTVTAGNRLSTQVLGYQTDYTYTHVHNDYLNHAVGGGLPLTALFAGMLLLPLWLAVRSRRDRAYYNRLYFAAMLSAGYAGAAMTNLVFRHDLPQTFFMCGLMFVAVSAIQSQNGIDRPVLWPDKPPLPWMKSAASADQTDTAPRSRHTPKQA